MSSIENLSPSVAEFFEILIGRTFVCLRGNHRVNSVAMNSLMRKSIVSDQRFSWIAKSYLNDSVYYWMMLFCLFPFLLILLRI
jgi:hypothetical protein